ncbi:hypothetical protein SCHPADRAFT_249050 [Schizopora paradoxa]|uniref:Uncharacterized protein n=1 Tax=Schizopora paradoxa TaxID=27342 RepID=A0A0H2S1V0_9AGAM|nr:hypothetical protein SCHPADRAFT_249050 [Schizopora paradoxa]
MFDVVGLSLWRIENMEELLYKRLDSPPLLKSDFGPSLQVRSETSPSHSQRVDEDAFMRLVSSFVHRLCIHPERIEAFTIQNMDDSFTDIFYSRIFSFFSNAYCVEFSGTTLERGPGNSAKGFTNFLSREAQSAERLDGAVALPSITTLIFDDVQFNLSNFKQLCIFLKHRKGRGEEVSFVRVNNCAGIGVKRRMDLKELVTLVQIDNNDDLNDVDGPSTKAST